MAYKLMDGISNSLRELNIIGTLFEITTGNDVGRTKVVNWIADVS